jgi:hypothetical protein
MASVFASLQGLPTTLTNGKIFPKMESNTLDGISGLPASEGDREYKQKYESEPIIVDEEGFTIYLSLKRAAGMDAAINDDDTPDTTFVRFTVGKSPTYSFFFGENSPSFLFTKAIVASILIDLKKNSVEIAFESNCNAIIVSKGNLVWDYADEKGTNGFFYQASVSDYPATLWSVAPYTAATVSMMNLMMSNVEEMSETLIKSKKDGNGIYIWETAGVKIHVAPQSFTFSSSLDKKYLKAPSFDYSKSPALDTNTSFIRFNCVIENPTLRTDNYTGYDKGDTSIHMTTLQFPGDEAMLAPMGTSSEGTETACGLESPEGRVLKSIFPIIQNGVVVQVKLSFFDGSFCIFPDAETGMFTATDKTNDGELQGVVTNLIVASGKWKESYSQEIANRISRNTNTQLTIEEDGKVLTSAIAWKTNKAVKILVPTATGSALITIPKRGA